MEKDNELGRLEIPVSGTLRKSLVLKLQSLVLSWAQNNLRSFPWRQATSTYEIMVAELLLKRTTAKAVSRIYPQFLLKYPNIESIVQGDQQDLEALLKPIGYNKVRAKELKVIAHFIMKNYEGTIPSDMTRLLDIPYIGPYTAGAILCFGFGFPAPMVDSNVERIFSRIFARCFNTKPSNKQILALVSEFIPYKSYKEFNLALLDLAALVCIPRNPRCNSCPLFQVCDFGQSSQRVT